MGNVNLLCSKSVEEEPEIIRIIEMGCGDSEDYEEKKLERAGLVSRCTGGKVESRAGVVELILSGPKAGIFTYVNQTAARTPPAFPGTVAEFIEKVPGVIPSQLRNKVKICRKCDKVNAYTLTYCNSCGFDLTEVEIGYTDNVFTGFIFGIKDAKFPLIISLRYQNERVMVFDDLLQLTPCHLNCIYTASYLPDLRCLFEMPKKGLALVEEMYEAAWQTVKKDYLGNEAFRIKIIPNTLNLADKDILKYVISGLNFPPSQFQLHLQFLLPPMMPFHYYMYLQGRHFGLERFFPVEYILDALSSLTEPMIGATNMDIEQIIKLVNVKTGVNYYKYHSECYARCGRSHRELAAWDPADFERVIVNGVEVCRASDMSPYEKQDLTAVKKEDVLGLQNYGRPFVNGVPSGTFYRYHKKPPLRNWLEVCD